MMKRLVTKLLTWMRGRTDGGGLPIQPVFLWPSLVLRPPNVILIPGTCIEQASPWPTVGTDYRGSSSVYERQRRLSLAGRVS
jgi:hypothetical protein